MALGGFGIERHVHGHSRNRNLVDFLPRHLEVRSAGLNHADLRINVAGLFFGHERLGDGIVQRGLVAGDAERAAEAGLDRTLVLIDRVDAHQNHAQQEPGQQAEENSDQSRHMKLCVSIALRARYHRPIG